MQSKLDQLIYYMDGRNGKNVEKKTKNIIMLIKRTSYHLSQMKYLYMLQEGER